MLTLTLAILAGAFPVQDDDARIRSCVRSLACENPADREAAAAELTRLGERVVRMLSESRESTQDGETKARLDDVLRRIRHGGPVTIERLRSTVIDLAMVKPTLSAVARELQNAAGITLQIDATADNDPDLNDFDYRRVSVESLLNHLGRELNYRWGIDRGRTVVFLPTTVFVARYAVRRKIDVRDLLRPVRGPDLLRLGLLGESEAGPAATEPTQLLSPDALLASIQNGTHPDSWYNEPARMVVEDGALVLWNVPEVCDDAERTIAALRETYLAPLRVKLSLVAVRESALDGLREGGGVRMDALRAAMAAGKDAALVAEQEIAVLNDVPTFGFSGRETPVVTDYTLDGRLIRQVVREGLGVTVRASATGDRRIRVSADATLCRLDRMERFATKQGEIQMPVLTSSIFRVDQCVPEDRTVVALSLGGVSTCGPEFSRLLVLVQTSRSR